MQLTAQQKDHQQNLSTARISTEWCCRQRMPSSLHEPPYLGSALWRRSWLKQRDIVSESDDILAGIFAADATKSVVSAEDTVGAAMERATRSVLSHTLEPLPACGALHGDVWRHSSAPASAETPVHCRVQTMYHSRAAS